MRKEEVKLLGFWASPFVLRVKWALRLKGIEYEYIEEDMSNKSSILLRYNPLFKKVPVFVHNGKLIMESLVIIEYIDETWKNHPLLPQDPFERARSRVLAKFVDDKCVPIVVKIYLSIGDQKNKMANRIQANMKTLESNLNPSKPFFGGEKLGYMDIAVAWFGIWAEIAEKIADVKLLDDKCTPLLIAWFRRVLEVPIIKECIPPLDKLVADKREFRKRLIIAKI